jgi:aminoglycoside phosphotransferase (APT) family kinase protein
MFREHRVQSNLNSVFPLAPKSLHFCDDESIIGSRFHIIERRRGFVIRKEFELKLFSYYKSSSSFNNMES